MKTASVLLLPEDALLAISAYLRIEDIIMFTSTCSTLRSLSLSRSLWIDALERVRRFRPLPCPPSENLAELDLPALIDIACHSARLEKNWSLPSPRIVGPVNKFSCGELTKVICCFPGTDLILLHSKESENATLWDVSSAAFLSAVYVGSDVKDTSLSHNGRGEFTIALLTISLPWRPNPSLEQNIRVLRVEYGHESVPTMRHIFVQNLQPFRGEFSHFKLFLHKDVVGAVEYATRSHSLRTVLVAWNMASHINVQIEQELLDIPTFLTCRISAGHLSVIVLSENTSHVIRYHRDVFPYGGHAGIRFDGAIEFEGPFTSIGSVYPTIHSRFFPSMLQYGTTGVFLYLDSMWPPSNISMGVIFWSESMNLSLLLSGPGSLHTEQSDTPAHPYGIPVAASHSGGCFLICNKLPIPPQAFAFHFLQYSRETESISRHQLESPSFINYSDISSVAIDECRGRVILITESGFAHIIPYA